MSDKVTNILLVGVGGQGTLLASEILSEAFMLAGFITDSESWTFSIPFPPDRNPDDLWRRLWPTLNTPISWPPAFSLTDEALDGFIASL